MFLSSFHSNSISYSFFILAVKYVWLNLFPIAWRKFYGLRETTFLPLGGLGRVLAVLRISCPFIKTTYFP